jgi:membrane protein YdbS with pleckstrin-like domain
VFDRRSKVPHVLFALHSALATLCVVGPGYKWWGASARPFVFGLPFSLAWAVGWLISVFVSLLLYERWTRHCEEAERGE